MPHGGATRNRALAAHARGNTQHRAAATCRGGDIRCSVVTVVSIMDSASTWYVARRDQLRSIKTRVNNV